MTIDEAIKREKIHSEMEYRTSAYADCDSGMSREYSYHIFQAEYHEQLAEWLEELKAMRNLDKTNFSDGYEAGRKDAIEEFIKIAEEERDNIFNWDEDEYENGMKAGYQYSIDIAEQMKEGGNNEN